MASNTTTVKKAPSATTAAGTGGLWFAGFIAALIYYIQYHSGTFWLVVLAILKAMIWPILLIYELMKFLKM